MNLPDEVIRKFAALDLPPGKLGALLDIFAGDKASRSKAKRAARNHRYYENKKRRQGAEGAGVQ